MNRPAGGCSWLIGLGVRVFSAEAVARGSNRPAEIGQKESFAKRAYSMLSLQDVNDKSRSIVVDFLLKVTSWINNCCSFAF